MDLATRIEACFLVGHLDLKASEGKVCIGMHAKDAWRFLTRQLLNGLPEDIDLCALRDTILLLRALILVELQAWCKNSLRQDLDSEPRLGSYIHCASNLS